MRCHLKRLETTKEHTLGLLSIGRSTLYVLERPWLNNKSNVSCIPTGTYNLRYIPRSSSGRYKRVYLLTPVSKRSGILIHTGNLVRHSKGCLLVGTRPGYIKSKRAVFNSRSALNKLRAALGTETLPKITIET